MAIFRVHIRKRHPCRVANLVLDHRVNDVPVLLLANQFTAKDQHYVLEVDRIAQTVEIPLADVERLRRDADAVPCFLIRLAHDAVVERLSQLNPAAGQLPAGVALLLNHQVLAITNHQRVRGNAPPWRHTSGLLVHVAEVIGVAVTGCRGCGLFNHSA